MWVILYISCIKINWEGQIVINITYGFRKDVKAVYEENDSWIVKESQYVFESPAKLIEYLENNCHHL